MNLYGYEIAQWVHNNVEGALLCRNMYLILPSSNLAFSVRCEICLYIV